MTDLQVVPSTMLSSISAGMSPDARSVARQAATDAVGTIQDALRDRIEVLLETYAPSLRIIARTVLYEAIRDDEFVSLLRRRAQVNEALRALADGGE